MHAGRAVRRSLLVIAIAGLAGAHSTEFDPESPHPVIALITEWQDRDGRVEQRDENSNLGGTMRLGGQECLLKDGSVVRRVYGAERIVERHRHRYEVNNQYLDRLKQASRSIGCTLEEPFLQLAFLSLPVIPSLKLTDKGLVDVDQFKVIDVRAS